MKAVLIIYTSDIDTQIMIALKQAGITNYSKWESIVGVGSSGAKLGTAIGPGTNKMLFLLLAEEKIEELLPRFENLKKSFLEKQGLKIVVLPVEKVI